MPQVVKVPVLGLDLTVTSVVWALVCVVVTFVVARYAGRAALRLGHRVQGVPDDLALQGARVTRYFVIVVGAGVVLAVLGAPIQPVLVAVLLVVAAAVLMARGIADNFGAGLVLQTRRPLRLGDLVKSCGYRGHVADLNSRTVVLETLDGRTVHLPNSAVMQHPLVNETTRGRCRSAVQVRVVPLDGDAAEELVATARRARGVLAQPAPSAVLVGTTPGRLTYEVRFWHEPDATTQVSSRVTHALDQALRAAGRSAAVVWPPPPPPLVDPGEI